MKKFYLYLQKKQASEAIAELAKNTNQYYVNHRWLGGMLIAILNSIFFINIGFCTNTS